MGRLDANQLRKWVNVNNSDFYYVGPVMFMKGMKEVFTELNIAEDRQFNEFYGPAM